MLRGARPAAQETWLDLGAGEAADRSRPHRPRPRAEVGPRLERRATLAKGKGGQDVQQIVPPAAPRSRPASASTTQCGRLTPVGQPRGSRRSSTSSRAVAPGLHRVRIVLRRPASTRMRGRSCGSTPCPTGRSAIVGESQVISLQYSIGGRPRADFTSGSWMNERDAGVMQQQVAQLAMNALFGEHYGDRVPGAFVGGLSMNLVVATYGQVNTRVDGDTRSRRPASARCSSPAAQSKAGRWCKNSAETRWRESQGNDHFIAPCEALAGRRRRVRPRPTRTSRRASPCTTTTGSAKHVVRAPFLGSAAAATKAPPQRFRATGPSSCAPTRAGSSTGCRRGGREREGVARAASGICCASWRTRSWRRISKRCSSEVYEGATLSNAEVDKDCLEGQFLRWLPKGK